MIIHFLEMLSETELKAKSVPPDFEINEAKVKNFRFNKFLYQLVGDIWSWTDKSEDSDDMWRDYAEAPELRTWVAYVQGSIAGYYELQQQESGNVEIVYFGLAPDFLGKGLGGYLLTHAIRSAWAMDDTRRLWVHTCTLDHPGALNNYKSRGFTLFDEKHC